MSSNAGPLAAMRSALNIPFRRVGILATVLVAVGLMAFVRGAGETSLVPAGAATTAAPAFALDDELLSFEDRVRYQRRIEEVYWQHRIWPTANPGPKPALANRSNDATPMRELGGEYERTEWRLVSEEHHAADFGTDRAKHAAIDLSAEEWRQQIERLTESFGPELSPNRHSDLTEEDDRFVVRSVLSKERDRIEIASVSWNKKTFDAWWEEGARAVVESKAGVGSVPPPAVGYELRMPVDGECDENSWTELWYVPSERTRHTAVWTGAEMIVWGGSNGGGNENTGGRYDPATDTWTATSTGDGVPEARFSHSAVWTGTEMIVWGGDGFPSAELNTGGRYDPVGDSWTPTSTGLGLPAPRADHTAVWTGTEMIVWG